LLRHQKQAAENKITMEEAKFIEQAAAQRSMFFAGA
jgi:hypothetical protein